MRKNILSVIFLLCSFVVISSYASAESLSSISENDTANNPYWIEMMQDRDANFFDTQRAFNLYWEDREITKGCGWKPFKRWESYWQTRVLSDGSFPSPSKEYNAFMDYSAKHKSVSGDWVELGPTLNPENGGGLGRVNCIAFHPADPNTMWAGAPAGGLWKTDNGGLSWTSNTDHLPTLGVSGILIDYTNTDIIYIGTGDRDAGDARGLGVIYTTLAFVGCASISLISSSVGIIPERFTHIGLVALALSHL